MMFSHFRTQNLGQSHDVYAQIDALLLADVFGTFWNIYIVLYEPDPAYL